jgi:hypothetical protein
VRPVRLAVAVEQGRQERQGRKGQQAREQLPHRQRSRATERSLQRQQASTCSRGRAVAVAAATGSQPLESLVPAVVGAEARK